MNHTAKSARASSAAVLTWAGLLTVLALLTGCTDTREALLNGKARSPGDVISVFPENGAKDVDEETRIAVKVPDGRLESVKVMRIEDAQQQTVAGRIAEDGRSWAPEPGVARLALAAKYSIDAVAVDAQGRRSARHATFTTLVPEHRFIGYFKPENRSTVGTGMIVSFAFSRPVADRAAVEKAIRVTSDPVVEVAGHWFGKDRLDFRPKTYWKPGTEVTVDIGLRDVEGAPGVYGSQDKTVVFTVGRHQISRVDAEAKTMEVRRDGELVSTVPITAGAPKTTTYNGKMVVTEMHEVTRMNGATVGFTDKKGKGEYDIKDVPHAIRLTTSGTFLHGNYWADESVFGEENVSHGCIGLRDAKGGGGSTPGGWFFDRTLIGDVVEVVNSKDKKVAPDNGLSGWNMTWKKWTAGSALR
ncbi:L,D-transpeptidase family protein [Streptomyces sp. MBT56]|uniref:L,D-transpeptidase n=1 Tax=Streptomyces TaxID=1883 RepID=UPI00190D8C57|nr:MULTISPECIES: Ig-like domain-containing protein [unclassified Streptomyces]MBK3561196.1 L,D-transpeptidase family protein [Streptomyces sp. MBT56]MBK3600517.1 L,D-transpeptidase family protein [Streptomyces sp. MBT54]MBK3618245.1 L,D-transpeptidase family protein [Streptomyces sp. MBT98]MBK6042975.1 L,D-transpeptidase family protein [Streptomyces sp. MBT55]